MIQRATAFIRRQTLVGIAMLLSVMGPLWAAQPEGTKPWSPEQITGLWEQYDDDTKQLSSLIRFVRTTDNHYEGFVEKVIPGPGEDPHPICGKCTGALKDKPVTGMRIAWGLWRIDDTHFEQGQILDPDDGTIYRLQITVLDHGRKLDVRGYKGFSFFGRSQTWLRANNQVLNSAVANPS